MPLAPRSGHVPIVYLVGVEADEGPIAREKGLQLLWREVGNWAQKREIVCRLKLGLGRPVGYREHPIGQRIFPDVRRLVWILQWALHLRDGGATESGGHTPGS